MRLALFDIDDTLIRGDCEVLWSRYLTREGLYDMSEIERFCEEYHAGTLDYDAFTRFQLAPLAALGGEVVREHRERFLAEEIAPLVCELLQERIADHRERGDVLLAISAAHDFLAKPISRMAGIDAGLYTLAERDGRGFTGRTFGRACFREGKIGCLEDWLDENGVDWASLEDTWFYSDSHNDLPLLRKVAHPVVVRPDDALREVAARDDWELIE